LAFWNATSAKWHATLMPHHHHHHIVPCQHHVIVRIICLRDWRGHNIWTFWIHLSQPTLHQIFQQIFPLVPQASKFNIIFSVVNYFELPIFFNIHLFHVKIFHFITHKSSNDPMKDSVTKNCMTSLFALFIFHN
jgi:hypothetical protein